MEDTKQKVKQTIIDALMLDMSPDELGDNDDLSKTLGIDSVGFLEILTALEEEFGLVLDDVNMTRQTARTVDGLTEMILSPAPPKDG